MANVYGSVLRSGQQTDSAEMSKFRSCVTLLADPSAKDVTKLMAAKELSEHFEVIIQCADYEQFLEHSMKIFISLLQDGTPHFIADYSIQQVRKLILEMIHRLPTTEVLRPYAKDILSLMLHLLQVDNEENVLVCLRIIIELHKHYRQQFNPEIQQFLSFVKGIYSDLPKQLPKIFEPRPSIRVKDVNELNLEQLLAETYTITPIQTDKKTAKGDVVTYNLIPKGVLSLKVLQELPIIVVLMYQIYKQSVHKEVADFVPLIMTTITLQPSLIHRNSPSFNKELYVDFMGAQIKTLSFLAYIIRLLQNVIVEHAPEMVKGMLSLLQSCPKEVAHLRKELLIAARHILTTDLKKSFVSSMDKLFNEDLLLGRGYTTHESLRPLAYSTLADLVHHVRQDLNINVLAKAVYLFSKNVHDESLPTSIQTMSCKLLLNLVDCIRQRSDTNSTTSRDLLITMLRVFTLKFHTIAKTQLPLIMQKWKSLKNEANSLNVTNTNANTLTISSENQRDQMGLDVSASEQTSKLSSIGFPQPNNLNVTEYRNLVKTLVCGVKTITWGCAGCKSLLYDLSSDKPVKMFQPHEILIFIDLVHWALEALDIYTINVPGNGVNGPQLVKASGQLPRSKEEKEALEHFSGVFLMMNNQNFQEIFASTIDYMVERISKNSALHIIANSFLANPTTSPLFATVLVEYLLERMEEMGSNIDRSNLYLRLFKLVFGSVSLFPKENEHMLRPHLHNIVNRSMELAMTAKEPYNYFLLLRALFRSIGGGSHEMLYQEFLPLLPNLLEGLNRLQSGFHKQHMKDLFVELCLTVPVRLSCLLPYLPMLMDPLVSALNGSHTLVSQGLRTLELCVDNLQPYFLYDDIQPVRADLMQALWRTLRNQDSAAQVAFRVLGKFGGGNRKMMIEPQRLEYNDCDVPPPAIIAHFQDYKKPINLSIDKIIETAFNVLKTSTTESFYWQQSWEVVRCYLAASLSLDDDKDTMMKLFMHPSFVEGNINMIHGQYKHQDLQARETHQKALTAMFVAVAIKELGPSILPTMVAVVRHYTMVAIAQQAGPFRPKQYVNNKLDPLVLIDALAIIMGHEEKELCQPGRFAMAQILETATNIMGSKERACRLPLMQYLAERMSALCYERPWYAKMGGCLALEFLYRHMDKRWLFQHLFVFLKAFMFVIMDLAGEVSSGAIDIAKTYLEKMIRLCGVPLGKDGENKELNIIQNEELFKVIHELVRQVISSNNLVRQQAIASLRLIAELQNKTVTEIMDPHREILADIIPPKKHLLHHQPANTQIGLMDGNTFCTTLEPRLFTIDLSKSWHKQFFDELLKICQEEDHSLNKRDCYKNVTNLVPLRTSALRALAACNYITDIESRDRILAILLKTLEKNSSELQKAAFECLQKFIAVGQINKELIHTSIYQLLKALDDYRNLTLNGTKQLSYLTQLFPSKFNEKLCEQLLQHINKMLEISITMNKDKNFLATANTGDTEQKITIILGIFHQIPAASSIFINSLCRLILQTEKNLMIESSCPFREPLVKFLLKFPEETIDLLLNDNNIKDLQWNRFTISLLKHKHGKPFRDVMQNKSSRLIQLIFTNVADGISSIQSEQVLFTSLDDRYESRHQTILIIHTLTEFDNHWLATQKDIIGALKNIWTTDLSSSDINVACDLWHLVAKILLHYFSHHTEDIDLLFLLLKALCLRFIPDFQFLRDFLQNTVAQNYTVEWKRAAFFRFVEHFKNQTFSQELKAKILTTVLIPCFAISFDKNEGNKLIGGPPMPDQDDENNVISVFIGKVIDPEKPFANEDSVRIALLQFACLFVERASAHLHDGDANNKKQDIILRRLMTFTWPCLLGKNCVDPAARYHGHLLLSHVITRLPMTKRIVLLVFHSLLKAHAIEARSVVKQALEVLTPAMPLRIEDGYTMLTHWTKKIIVEEGHSMQQLLHILQLIVRHYKVYYPVRHHLVQYMINSIQRLGFSATATLEYRKLAVELAEVIIKWELQRIKDSQDGGSICENDHNAYQGEMKYTPTGAVRRGTTDDYSEPRKKMATDNSNDTIQSTVAGPSNTNTPKVEVSNRPIDKVHCDTILNFLFRLACQVNDATPIAGTISPSESLSRRCVTLIKMAIKPDVWSHPCDLNLIWLDKIFPTAETIQPNYGNICTALELLTFLLGVMKTEQVLTIFHTLERGLSACVTSTCTRVTRLMHSLLSRLMSIFPTDNRQKYEKLDTLYTTVSKMICKGLAAYEQNSQVNSSSLFGPLMILKAACTNNPNYIDCLMVTFIKVLNRLTKEHLITPSTTVGTNDGSNSNSVALELLILSLDLIKTRIVAMSVDIRKSFIGGILVGLIEKSTESKVIKAIIKIIEDWMKSKNNPMNTINTPNLREKSILLVKLMQQIEKRFSDDQELNGQFLELINYIYHDDYFKQTELTSKLEAAFLAGLRCNQPHIRAKFFKIFDGSVRKRLHDRLLYIVCSHAWDSIGQHYWIKQCIELLISTANTTFHIQNPNDTHLLPSISSIIHLADLDEKETFSIYTSLQCDSINTFDSVEDKEDVFDMDMNVDSNMSRREDSERPVQNREIVLMKLINRQSQFLEQNRKIRTEQLLIATAQLCHMDSELAEKVWLDIFPSLWTILDKEQRQTLQREIIHFLASGTDVNQKDCYPSALNTFVEAIIRCQPLIELPPDLMTYLGKAHNLWHRMTITLEEMALNSPQKSNIQGEYSDPDISDCNTMDYDQSSVIFDPLSQMYLALHEEDLWAGLWLKFAKYPETNNAIAFEQMGFFEEAQASYELVMSKFKQDISNSLAPLDINSELQLWESHWIRCAKELNEWDILLDYAQSSKDKKYFLIMESAWRVPDWTLMKQALLKVEQICPKHEEYKVNLYRGFLAILNQSEQDLTSIERYVEVASILCMREWRRLPPIVSHIHLPILQASQQIMELQEACQIQQSLLPARNSSLHDMKAIVKTWSNRLPVIADDLSHWSDIFTWRQHHYQIITSHLEQENGSTNNLIGAHASAQAIIHFGKMARKHNLTAVCQHSLDRIYTLTEVPVIYCFEKIHQQIKCFLQMAASGDRSELQKALDVIESTNTKYFQPDTTAEFLALKGLLLAQCGKSNEANEAFDEATKKQEKLVKPWALWGDYLEHIFISEPKLINLGINALVCFLYASRHQNESKSRKYLAKVLWLLSYDDEKSSLMKALDENVAKVLPLHWLPWIPQLLCCLVYFEGNVIVNLLVQVARMLPQAVYFPIRTLFSTLQIEQKHKQAQEATLNKQHTNLSENQPNQSAHQSNETASISKIITTPAMRRCLQVMLLQREYHPTILNSLEGIISQTSWFRGNWYEEVLRQLRQGLTKCYAIAFENRNAVNETIITLHALNFVKKLISTFGTGIDNISNSASSTTGSESLARHSTPNQDAADLHKINNGIETIGHNSSQSTFSATGSDSLNRQTPVSTQDPVFQKIKDQFKNDFDFSQPGSIKLQILINKLKKWIRILEQKTKQLPKSFLIEEKCRFLSNFSQKTAEVELPGELLLPRHSHYHIRIARFMPRVEIVQKHNTAARRLYIRGTNGKIYPYLVVNDSGLGDARREERVLQMLRMLNHYLAKQKETSRRFLHITVPRVVPVSPQMRLVEDKPSSISLLDIYKNDCSKINIEHDLPIKRYYERLAEVQARGSQTTHTVLRDILREVQTSMVPKNLFKNWTSRSFRSASDYWQFRKMFTLQLSLASFSEHVFHLTRLNADMMYIHQDSGLINISYFTFDIDDFTGELDSNRSVPFRLTPNIGEFLSNIGISGPFVASAIATARCLVQPNFKLPTILRVIMRDEIISVHKKRMKDEKPIIDSNGDVIQLPLPEVDMGKVILLVNKAVKAITGRLNNIASFENVESNRMSALAQAAQNPDNLCLMDPTWFAWL